MGFEGNVGERERRREHGGGEKREKGERETRLTKSNPSSTPSTRPAVKASHEREDMSFGMEMCWVKGGTLREIISVE